VKAAFNRGALWHASYCGSKELVDLLLAQGQDPNEASNGFTALHEAAASDCGDEKTITEIALAMINAGAQMDSNNIIKTSALHCASDAGNVTLIKELLTRLPAKELNFECPISGTPLYNAAFRGHVEAVKVLLDAGADINLGWKDESPLQAAIAEGHVDVTKLLEDKDDGSTITPTSSLHESETSVEQEAGDESSVLSSDTADS
jgi:ankyrin repeat protein